MSLLCCRCRRRRQQRTRRVQKPEDNTIHQSDDDDQAHHAKVRVPPVDIRTRRRPRHNITSIATLALQHRHAQSRTGARQLVDMPPTMTTPMTSATATAAAAMAAAVAATVRRGAPDCTSARIATSSKEDAAADMALENTIPRRRGREQPALTLARVLS